MAASMGIQERFPILLERLGISQEQFCESLGTARSCYYNYVNGKQKTFNAFFKVFEIYPQVSAEWLIRGKGPVLLAGHQDPTYSVPEDYHNYQASEAIATASASSNGTAKATANTSGRASAHSTGNASASAESTPVTLPPVEGLNRHELLSFLSHKIEETQKQLTIYNLMIQQTLNSPE